MRKLSEKEKLMLKSAIRHFVLVALPVWQVSNGDIKAFGYALAAAIIGPALRGIDRSQTEGSTLGDESAVHPVLHAVLQRVAQRVGPLR